MSKERLTERYREIVHYPRNVECTSICDDCDHMGKMTDKLAEYEDFEEILRDKLTEEAVNVITASKKTFSEWLNRILWTNKKCDEFARKVEQYQDLEEQGLLLRLPCKVGDFIYYPSSYHNAVIPVRVNEIIISFVGIDNYSYQWNCCSFDGCGDIYEDYEFDNLDIGKTVFLTQSEAEEKLRELEELQDAIRQKMKKTEVMENVDTSNNGEMV